jgi:hypothetical protein
MKRVLVLCTVMVTVLSITVPAVAQPGNDDLATATQVTGLPFQESVDTTAATTEPGEPVEGEFCPQRGSTVWYALTLSDSQAVTVDTAGSDFDTTLAVYTGNDFTDLELVDCNDDTFFGLQAALTFTADAGVTYLIQAGSFGGDDGGQLSISIGEPGAVKGKPIIFRSKFKGSIAEAFTEEFDEVTGAFSAASATLVDGQSSEGGKPSRFSTLFVSEFSETFDEVNETVTFTEWFGAAELSNDEFEIDKKLRSAWVMTGVVLEGQSCTGTFESEELECVELGSANVDVDLSWDGIGGVEKTRFMEKTTFDGVRFSFRGRVSTRQADVLGGWSGDLTADLTGGFGSISQQATGDFVMIRGADLP